MLFALTRHFLQLVSCATYFLLFPQIKPLRGAFTSSVRSPRPFFQDAGFWSRVLCSLVMGIERVIPGNEAVFVGGVRGEVIYGKRVDMGVWG